MVQTKELHWKNMGTFPKLTKYAYTSSIRPIIAFGAFDFAHRLANGHKRKLKSFQRQVLMQPGNFRKGTPCDALEIMTDTAPLDLFLEAEMIKCNYRIRPFFDEDWTRLGSRSKQGYILKAKIKEEALSLPFVGKDEIDQPIWDRKYSTDKCFEGNDTYKGL